MPDGDCGKRGRGLYARPADSYAAFLRASISSSMLRARCSAELRVSNSSICCWRVAYFLCISANCSHMGGGSRREGMSSPRFRGMSSPRERVSSPRDRILSGLAGHRLAGHRQAGGLAGHAKGGACVVGAGGGGGAPVGGKAAMGGKVWVGLVGVARVARGHREHREESGQHTPSRLGALVRVTGSKRTKLYPTRTKKISVSVVESMYPPPTRDLP